MLRTFLTTANIAHSVAGFGAVLLCALSVSAQDRARPSPFRDAFRDGSGSFGPWMVPIPQMDMMIGARSDEPDFGGEPEIRHRVHLSAYAAGEFEVTNAEFAVFLNDERASEHGEIAGFNPAAGGQLRKSATGWRVAAGGMDLPVVGVSWNAAQTYARWLSWKTHRQYRLPTSAEWEVAARGGTETAWWWGDAAEGTGATETHAGHARAASELAPNPWGLYGVEGNVWQWSGDCFHRDAAELAARNDPEFFDAGCRLPEIRGGSFKEGPEFARSAYRSNLPSNSGLENVGFRLVRTAEPKPDGHGLAVEYSVGVPAEVWALASRGKEAPQFEGLTRGGRLPALTPGLHLLLADSASGLVLFDGKLPESGPIRVDKVVRLTGKIAGAAPGSVVRAKVGTGERIAPLERWLRYSGATSPLDERVHASFGVPLPLSPSRWRNAYARDGEFDSGWILAQSPQVVLYDSAGDALVRDVALPEGLGAHENLDTGVLQLAPTRELHVSVKVPKTGLDLPLTLGVHDILLGDADAAEVGSYLSALDQIDAGIFGLLVLNHGYSLPPNGDAYLRFLPNYSAMTFLVHDPRSDQAIERSVQLKKESTVQVTLTERGESAATATLKGRVYLSGSATVVPGATVVVSQYPIHGETITDAEGRFIVEGLSSGAPADIAVTVPAATASDVFVRSQVFRQVSVSKAAELAILGINRRYTREAEPRESSWSPKPPRLPTKGFAGELGEPNCANLSDGQYGLYTSWLAQINGKQTDMFSVLHAANRQAAISMCSTGDWGFLYSDNVVDAYTGEDTVTESDKAQNPLLACSGLPACPTACYTRLFTMKPLQKQVDRLLTFTNKNGFARPGINVEISPIEPLISLDPTALVADSQGRIKLCGVDTNPIHVFASDPSGTVEYDCTINLLDDACQAYVPDGVTNSKAACNQTLLPTSCREP